MGEKQIKKGLSVFLKFSIACLILFIIGIIGSNLEPGKSFLRNGNDDTLKMAEAAEENGIFTVSEFTYKVESAVDKTVCITGMKPNEDTTELVIPETVTYHESTYTVTDINFDNKSVQYERVRTIKIPASVTGKILITSTDLQGTLPEEARLEARPYCVPFPNLEKVIFLGKTAPKSINIFSYLSYNDIDYQVPSGSEADYEAVSQKSFLQPVMCFYDYDDTCPFKEYEVAPVIISDKLTNPEPHLFQTDQGVYIVTDSAADGKGTAALIKCKKLVRKYNFTTPNSGNFIYPEWDDYTIESEAVYGSYQYSVTSMEAGALLDFRNITMLTIPDTITQMKEDCIYAGNYLNFVFFSKNCKTISSGIFNSGENGFESGILLYVPGTVTKMEETFYSDHLNKLYLPKGISVPKKISQAFNKIIYYNKTYSTLDNEIKISSNKISAVVGTTKKINAADSNSKIKDTIHYISMDPGVAAVSDKGVITPKHKGTAYVLVFSEATGAHQLIQVNVENKTFTQGIFTYRINYSSKPEVTVISCKPAKTMKVLTIPASVVYKGKKYTVTQVCAGDYVIDEYNWQNTSYSQLFKSGYLRENDTTVPLISEEDAKGSNITEVIFPSTIKRTASSLGNLTKLTKIIFKGTTAPSLIALSEQNYNMAALYVPAKALTAYKKTNWKWSSNGVKYSGSYSKKSIINLKTY